MKPIATTASRSPMISTTRGEKLAICVFVELAIFDTKFVGNSIMLVGPRGSPTAWPHSPLFFNHPSYGEANSVKDSEG